jgi:hypothetical protein
MNKSSGHKKFYGLLVLFLMAGSGMAQEGGGPPLPAPACTRGEGCQDQQASISIMDASPVGLPAQVAMVSTEGMAVALQDNAEVVKDQPYQAQAVTQIKQTLGDGSHIAQTTTATVARDSEGRTVRVQRLSTIGPWKSASDVSEDAGPTLTTIFDPVAKTHTDFISDKKVAHVMSIPTPPPGSATEAARGFAVFSAGPQGEAMGPSTFAVQARADSSQVGDRPDVKTDSLGTSAIEGIAVTGTRTTKTIPQGTIGNDKDIVITRETWYSPDLKMVVQSTQSDPRFGQTTYSLTNIQRNEPDPTLFQIPAGYSIEKLSLGATTR